MKGIAHFAVGVAAASCFPGAVQAGADGDPLYFILGGVFGLLPDTLDFKFYRFFYRQDVEVVPDPLNPDPGMIAEAVALAVNRAAETGKPVRIKLCTVRMGPDLWQQYKVRFDTQARCVSVEYGPVVDTSQNAMAAAPPKSKRTASAPLSCPVKLDYQASTTVDIFDGPLFEMAPAKGGSVTPLFIPWHREWSHSLVMDLLFALIATVWFGPMAGAVGFAGMAAHIAVDQLGFLGSNLTFPFGSRRTEGLKLMHSGESLPNFMTVWTSCLVIFWNLYRVTPGPLPPINLIQFLVYGACLPVCLFMVGRRLVRAVFGGR